MRKILILLLFAVYPAASYADSLEGVINKVYEKKGHEFIDVFVNLFDQKDEACVLRINLIAIYKLRGSY